MLFVIKIKKLLITKKIWHGPDGAIRVVEYVCVTV